MKKPPRNEHILLVRRKHWFILFSELLGPVFFAVLPFVVYPAIAGREILLGTETFVLEIDGAILTFAGAIWLLLWWMRIVGVWFDYYLDVWTVTDKHILDKEQHGFFHRQTSVFRLERIQDVNVETRGLIATLLHFGDLHVQTAGESKQFIIRGVANPKHVREVILDAINNITEKEFGIESSQGL